MRASGRASDPGSDGPGRTGATISRRRFVVALGGAAASVALRPQLALARKLARPQPALQPWTLPANPPADPLALSRALVSAAVLAPSHWNTQPWRMEANNATIRLVADTRRALPVTDPGRTAMMISLGAALENMLVAMRSYGLRPAVTYAPDGGKGAAVAEVTWIAGEPRRDRGLFAAIPERRTNRRNYDGRGIFMQNRAALTAQVPGELRLHWLDDRDAIRALADVVRDATHTQVLDKRAQAEHLAWMRFGDDQARETGDGITVEALELGGPARWLAGRYFNPRSRFLGFGAGSAAKQAHEAVMSSGAVALFTAPRGTESAGLVTGQAYERFALMATRLGIAHQPIHAPIEVASSRVDLLRQFGALGEEPMLLVRLGHAKRPPPSVRRAITLVASFRNS